jgi:predicted component of type VI protein secretion system
MTITDFEPRVRTTECVVIPNEDQNEYNIDLIIEILAIKTQTRIYSDLDLKSQSFKFLETRPKQRI